MPAARPSLLASAMWLVLVGAAPGEARLPPPPAFRSAVRAMVEEDGAPGVIALVYRDGRLLYRAQHGRIDPDRPLPVASASKWVAAALIMTLVDDGTLSLDDRVGKLLPEIGGEPGRITLRQLLSFTSGQGGLEGLADVRQPPGISLAESARLIAARPMPDRPGTAFRYGSGALQIAGAMAERASGKSWRTLFNERLAGPLGMAGSHWSHPLHARLAPDGITNPNLQGGLIATADDYARFLAMVAAGGMAGKKRILSRAAVDEMERLQTAGLAVELPREQAGRTVAGYALGNWCERADAKRRCTLVSSPGALGTTPWIDRDSGLYGLFFMRHRYPRVARSITAARDAAIGSAAASERRR